MKNDVQSKLPCRKPQKSNSPLSTTAPIVVCAGEGWHPGVIGIVAGRIKEKARRPAVVIALDSETGEGKGSGRSIPGVDLGAAIIGATDSGLLVKGGGHAMAAGLTIAADKLDAFTEWMDERLAGPVASASADQHMTLDLALAPRGLTPELVETLDSAGPLRCRLARATCRSGPCATGESRHCGNAIISA